MFFFKYATRSPLQDTGEAAKPDQQLVSKCPFKSIHLVSKLLAPFLRWLHVTAVATGGSLLHISVFMLFVR